MTGRSLQDDIVLTWVEPKGGVVTAWPNQVAIIMRDGRITDVFTEGTRRIGLGFLPSGRVQAFIAYTVPFSLTFRLEDEYGLSEWEDGIPLQGVVLTADGRTVTAQFGMSFSVIPEKVDLLLRLSPTGRPIKTSDIGNAIKGELLAKVLTLDIRSYTAAELRGNETLLRSLYDSLRRELHSTLSGYGLQLDNFYANWGLTDPEGDRLGELQHQQRLREIERQQELHRKLREGEERGESQRSLAEAPAREEERAREERLRLEEARVREETRVREEARLREEARVREEEDRYRRFFLKVAEQLKSIGFHDPPTGKSLHWLEFSTSYPWVHYRAGFLPDLNEARVMVAIHNHDPARNKRLFNFILEDKENIEAQMGPLIWERDRHRESHISVRLPNRTIHDSPETLQETEDWLVQTLRDFGRVFWRQLPTKPPWSGVRNWSHASWRYKPDSTVPSDISLEEWWEPREDKVAVGLVIRSTYRTRYEGQESSQEEEALAQRQEVVSAFWQHREAIEAELGQLDWLTYTDRSQRICQFLPDRTGFDDDAAINATREWLSEKIEAFKSVFQPLMQTIEFRGQCEHS